MRRMLLLVPAVWLGLCAMPTAQTPEARAVGYLSAATASWHADHGCYSCHDNGDAARALLMAAHRGFDVGDALADTRRFLNDPARWADNKSHEDDDGLERLQFAAALATDGERDLTPAKALVDAATLLLADQMPDGSWVPDASDGPGSPLTWGTPVATWQARSVLIASGREPDDFAVAAIDRWTRTIEVDNITDAAGVLLALGVTSDVMADKQRATLLNLIRFAQRDGGGWGALPNAESATVFDTALVMTALEQFDADPRLARSTYRVEELREAIAKGRAYLISRQQPDGSWPETMRGSATTSAAQRLSTTSWALIALLGSGH